MKAERLLPIGIVICVVAVTGAAVIFGIAKVKSLDERARCAQKLKLLRIAFSPSINSDEPWGAGTTNILEAYSRMGVASGFICPSDTSRRGVSSFSDLQIKGSSYEARFPAGDGKTARSLEESANHIVLRCRIHLNVAMADGSVHTVTPQGLTNLMRLSGQ